MENQNTDNKTNQENNYVPYLSLLLRSSRVIANQRFLAYASEVGESFRPNIHRNIVRGSYALSLGYVASDVFVKSHDTYKTTHDSKKTAIETTDSIIWHSFASMILPAVTIHSIVKYTGKFINKANLLRSFPRFRGWLPTLIGLSSIPFIIHPLDHATDFAMDNTVRRLYRNENKKHN